jgi:hypothetical protein
VVEEMFLHGLLSDVPADPAVIEATRRALIGQRQTFR